MKIATPYLAALLLVGPLADSSKAERFFHEVVADFETTQVLTRLFGGYNDTIAGIGHTGTLTIPLVNSEQYELHSIAATLELEGASYSSGYWAQAWHSGNLSYSVHGVGPSGAVLNFVGNGHNYREFSNGAGGATRVVDSNPHRQWFYRGVPIELEDFLYDPSSSFSAPSIDVTYQGNVSATADYGAWPGTPFFIGGSAAAGITFPRLTLTYELEERPEASEHVLPTSDGYESGLIGHFIGSNDTPVFPQEELPDSFLFAGDYDSNLVVDERDHELWQSTYSSGDDFSADGNGDGLVDAADYSVWRDNLGNGFTTTTVQEAVRIPEPSALLAQLVGAALVLAQRRTVQKG